MMTPPFRFFSGQAGSAKTRSIFVGLACFLMAAPEVVLLSSIGRSLMSDGTGNRIIAVVHGRRLSSAAAMIPGDHTEHPSNMSGIPVTIQEGAVSIPEKPRAGSMNFLWTLPGIKFNEQGQRVKFSDNGLADFILPERFRLPDGTNWGRKDLFKHLLRAAKNDPAIKVNLWFSGVQVKSPPKNQPEESSPWEAQNTLLEQLKQDSGDTDNTTSFAWLARLLPDVDAIDALHEFVLPGLNGELLTEDANTSFLIAHNWKRYTRSAFPNLTLVDLSERFTAEVLEQWRTEELEHRANSFGADENPIFELLKEEWDQKTSAEYVESILTGNTTYSDSEGRIGGIEIPLKFRFDLLKCVIVRLEYDSYDDVDNAVVFFVDFRIQLWADEHKKDFGIQSRLEHLNIHTPFRESFLKTEHGGSSANDILYQNGILFTDDETRVGKNRVSESSFFAVMPKSYSDSAWPAHALRHDLQWMVLAALQQVRSKFLKFGEETLASNCFVKEMAYGLDQQHRSSLASEMWRTDSKDWPFSSLSFTYGKSLQTLLRDRQELSGRQEKRPNNLLNNFDDSRVG